MTNVSPIVALGPPFVQPLMLAALPLIALPILIHLINQRRYQTLQWAAMMFLLTANRMSRGYARLRQILILIARTLAIAGLIFAVSRPLASGWLGLAGGTRADTTIVLIDRSPSMHQQGAGTNVSKLETGRQQIVRALNMLRSSRWVLIESNSKQPLEIDAPDAIAKLPQTEAASASADLPAMLEAAQEYVRSNQVGRTEIWICSDLRQNDWNAESVRWQKLREAFLKLPQSVRLHLLAYPEAAASNLSLRVTGVRRQQTGEDADLLVSLEVVRQGPLVRESPGGTVPAGQRNSEESLSVPVRFDIGGARSEVTIELTGDRAELKDHRIPLERAQERGWGRVSIPADANAADNEFFFAHDKTAPRKTVLVTEDAASSRSFELAASISPDPSFRCEVETVERDQLASIAWDQVALLIWQGTLPAGAEADQVTAMVERGGQVLFLPPSVPDDVELFGLRWTDWIEANEPVPVETWRSDQDLLANTLSGAALPVGQLQVRRHCQVAGDATKLATLTGEAPLVVRATTNRGGVYFCSSTATPRDSSLAADGIVLYVLCQRAIALGAATLGNTRQLIAGEVSAIEKPENWNRVAGATESISSEYAFHAGVFGEGERLLAVNRAAAEDQAAVLPGDRVAELFQGLDFTRVDDKAGSFAALVQEIWRVFLAAMMIALLVEAALCLPRRSPAPAPPAPTATHLGFAPREHEVAAT